MHTDETKKESFKDILKFCLIAIPLVLLFKAYIAQPFIVSGASMESTFHDGQYLIVDEVTYYFKKPSRGDVIIFRPPVDTSKYFIKRIIGLPHETVIINAGVVSIKNALHPEGFVLDEPYVEAERRKDETQTTILEDGEYFVMGDNRLESYDSRRWGALVEKEIVGRPLVRLFPLNRIDAFPGFYQNKE